MQLLIDIPAHILFLLAQHRFAVLLAAVFLPALISRKNRRRWHLIGPVWLLVILNLVGGTYLASYALYHLGASAPAEITNSHGTDTRYNGHFVVSYDVSIKVADGKLFDTSFEDDDFNLWPSGNEATYPGLGDRFNVRYLPTFPDDFLIVTDDASPWTQKLACGPLEQKKYEAEAKYEFGDHGATYRAAYIAAIEALIAGNCYEGNADILAEYRREIEEAKAAK